MISGQQRGSPEATYARWHARTFAHSALSYVWACSHECAIADRVLRTAMHPECSTQVRKDKCTDMCMDMYTDKCTDMCTDMYTDMCTDMYTDMCTDMYTDMCTDMCTDRICGGDRYLTVSRMCQSLRRRLLGGPTHRTGSYSIPP